MIAVVALLNTCWMGLRWWVFLFCRGSSLGGVRLACRLVLWVEVAGCFLFVLLDSDLGVSFALCAGV